MRRYVTVVLCMTMMLLIFPTGGWCLNAAVSGRVSSGFVLRDTNGFQNGFLDHTEGVQWRNELKFDLTLRPEYITQPDFRLEQVFLSYRGAYDAIFAIRNDKYGDIREKSQADFELGKDDIEWENDLREAFMDLVAQGGMQKTVVRLGRQIVQWGEADGFNLLNVVCPNDYSWHMFFADPQDTATPLWMARLNYTVAGVSIFDTLGLELLAIPDIRPNQTAPFGGKDGYTNFDAPYAYLYEPFKYVLAGYGFPRIQQYQTKRMEEVVPGDTLDNMEYGGALSMAIGGLHATLNYLTCYQDDAAMDVSGIMDFFAGRSKDINIYFRHPRQRVMGGSFNYFFAPFNCVVRGEGSKTSQFTFTDAGNLVNGLAKRDLYQGLLGVDKDLHPKFLGTASALTTNMQFYWRHIDSWQEDKTRSPTELDDHYRITLMMLTDYYNGRITPSIFAMYDPKGTWMTNASVKYDPDGKWLFQISQMSFWGNKDAISPFSGLIGASEMSFTATYRF